MSSAAAPSNSEKPVTVLGGGIVGLSLARELAGRGARVTLLEARRVGAGASTAAIGVLSAPEPRRSALARLARYAYEMHPVLARELREETGLDVEYRECGSVTLFDSLPRRPERTLRHWARAGVEARWLELGDLRDLIPGYGGRPRHGLWLDREALVHPGSLVEALRRSCDLRGVAIREEVGDLRLVRGASGEVAVASDSVPGGHGESLVVLAAGSWSSRAAREAPEPGIRVEPVRGQALELRHPPPRCIVHFTRDSGTGYYYLVPRGENRIWVGSTVEEVGFQDDVTPEGRIELLEATRAVLPDVDDGRVERLWSGLRPKAMRRGGPYLGPWPGVRNLWVACGHYRSGILLGPLSGRLVARNLLEDRPLDEDFSVAGREAY